MINYDSLTLRAQTKEFFLEGGRIQKVQQPTRRELLLTIRANGKTYKFYTSINPSFAHAAILSEVGEKLRMIDIPQKPPMFCMLLRKYLVGAKINSVRQPDNERIIEIYFESYNELGERIPMVLAIELMGKHSNIVLYNYDTNVIIGCAHNVSSEKSREREMAGTLPYIYPPKQKKIFLPNITESEFIYLTKAVNTPFNVWLNENFHDVSLAVANEICEFFGITTEKNKIISISEDKIFQIYKMLVSIQNLEHLKPSISSDKKNYSLISLDTNNRIFYNSINEMVDLYFGKFIFEEKTQKLRSSLLSIVNKEMKRLKNSKEKLSSSLKNAEKAEQYRQIADTLMANLYNIEASLTKFKTLNVHTMEEIEILLDEKLSANENAQKYYKAYNKAKTAFTKGTALIGEIDKDILYFESVKLSVAQSETPDEFEQIRDELAGLKLIKNVADSRTEKQAKQKKNKEKFEIESREIDGLNVYIGKNNRQNDYIVSKLAAPNDIWLHAQEIPGSHVLIKLPSETIDISEETIYKAAVIAAQHSQAKDSVKVPVIYVRRKFLKKPQAAKPGYVTYSNEKMFVVKL